MNAADVISRKRDAQILSDREIRWFVDRFTNQQIPDYQMAALAMAIAIRGMTESETAALTDAMLRSGQILSWPAGGLPKVDKHSSGGVGDKVSLILAPLLASCDVQVPKISGRGLGATGGTIDKLEAIPGLRTDLSLAELRHVVDEVGCVITAATAEIAPADRKLYALRDVTGTIPSIPLITASIMSKKLAEGLDALVLDVKWGSGAFMKSLEAAHALAQSLEKTGQRMGVATAAMINDMNQPLGRKVGNALEVQECLAVLRGECPADLLEITLALGARALMLARVVNDEAAARRRLMQALDSGQALDRFQRMVRAQGGDADASLKIAGGQILHSDYGGRIECMDSEQIGYAIIDLGGGRRQMEDTIDHSVGLEMMVRIGDQVQRGQPLVMIHADRANPGFVRARERVRRAIVIQD
jgi:pyrimidine-nucleoside phosphorylase